MDFSTYISHLEADAGYRGQIVHREEIPARSPRYSSPIEALNPTLDLHLAAQGITRLYSHQARALDSVRSGRHVMIVTAAASGKTLCYNLPAIEAVLGDPRSRAIYLYPTKALAQDQLGKLNDFGLFPTVRFATYDGDTPKPDRAYIRKGAHLVLTNPDMVHVGILPNHTMWAQFFANLRFIVIDEIHSYRGVFGAHVAQVVRRLRRLSAHYDANPQIIACSATIANPAGLMHALTGVEPTVIEDDGAPRAKRHFVFWNPPLVGDAGDRRSAHVEATALFTDLVAHDIRTLTFAKARKSAELILKYARETFNTTNPPLAAQVMSYRAGYTAEERRRIERGLFDGDLMGVTTTNALELGVDVGGLDATVLTGYPGTIASAWQQAGRSGRAGGEALSIMIALDNPLDQFLMRHPEYFFGKPSEQAIVNAHNPRILRSHLACAAHEFPLSEFDSKWFGPEMERLLPDMVAERELVERGGRWYYRGEGSPAARTNIRSASSESYEIRDVSRPAAEGRRILPPPLIAPDGMGRLMGSAEDTRVFHTLHPGAIYLHQGDTFLVQELDAKQHIAWVAPSDANYYTEPRDVTSITILEQKETRPLGPAEAFFGEVVVSNQVVGYRCKQLYKDNVLDIVDLDLPEQVFETEAFWFTVPAALVADLAAKGLDLGGSIHAAEHACIGMMPLLATCDRWDLGGVSYPHYPDTGMATVFIYDGHPGGVGIAESTYHRLTELLTTTQQMIAECPCEDGCPSCIQSPKCGNNNEPLDKRGAAFLLEEILKLAPPSALEATAPPVESVIITR